jgi:hypothetical protein
VILSGYANLQRLPGNKNKNSYPEHSRTFYKVLKASCRKEVEGRGRKRKKEAVLF